MGEGGGGDAYIDACLLMLHVCSMMLQIMSRCQGGGGGGGAALKQHLHGGCRALRGHTNEQLCSRAHHSKTHAGVKAVVEGIKPLNTMFAGVKLRYKRSYSTHAAGDSWASTRLW